MSVARFEFSLDAPLKLGYHRWRCVNGYRIRFAALGDSRMRPFFDRWRRRATRLKRFVDAIKTGVMGTPGDAWRLRSWLKKLPALDALPPRQRLIVLPALVRQIRRLAEVRQSSLMDAAGLVVGTYGRLFPRLRDGLYALAMMEHRGLRYDDDATALDALSVLVEAAKTEPVHLDSHPATADAHLARLNGLLEQIEVHRNRAELLLPNRTISPHLLRATFDVWGAMGSRSHQLGRAWILVCLATRARVPTQYIKSLVGFYPADRIRVIETLFERGEIDTRTVASLMFRPRLLASLPPHELMDLIVNWQAGPRTRALHELVAPPSFPPDASPEA